MSEVESSRKNVMIRLRSKEWQKGIKHHETLAHVTDLGLDKCCRAHDSGPGTILATTRQDGKRTINTGNDVTGRYPKLLLGIQGLELSALRYLAALAALVAGTVFGTAAAKAQSPGTFRIPPVTMQDHVYEGGAELQAATEHQKVIIDSDPGVDDTLALLWLFSQQEYPIDVLGAVAVAGNSSVENTASNLITILELAGHPEIPVIVGAKKPLKEKLTLSTWLIHGPDGLWFAGQPQDLSDLAKKPDVYYCTQAEENPDAKILALGPLTNLALAIKKCGSQMQNFNEVIVLGGAKVGGNQTPVTEYNFWQDPDAAKIVSEAGLNLTIIPFDAFAQFAFGTRLARYLVNNGSPAVQALREPIIEYLQLQITSGGPAVIPDAAAAIYALDHAFGAPQRALVRVLTGKEAVEIARGQSIVGLVPNERITMLADDELLSDWAEEAFSNPDFDLNAEIAMLLQTEDFVTFGVDNANFVFDVDENAMLRRFITDLTQGSSETSAASFEIEELLSSSDSTIDTDPASELQETRELYLPSILNR